MGVYWGLLSGFFKIGLFAFGGGYATLALIEREMVTARAWLTPAEFVDVVALAEMTPGPIAVNAATYVGYRTAGLAGSALATLGVVLPSFIIIITLAGVILRHQHSPKMRSLFSFLRPAVIALIASAAVLIARDTVTDVRGLALASVVFVALTVTEVHPILLLILAGAAGALLPLP